MAIEHSRDPWLPKKQPFTDKWTTTSEAEYAANLSDRNFAQWKVAKELKLREQKQRNDLITKQNMPPVSTNVTSLNGRLRRSLRCESKSNATT
jgi:hypothetical protein